MTEEGEVCYVTTVYDLTLANYGVNRGLGGEAPKDFYDDVPFTPAWQEKITGVKRELVIQIAREFAQNALDTNGRSMIIMGAGINHWFNSDTIYRAVLNLVLSRWGTRCERRRLGTLCWSRKITTGRRMANNRDGKRLARAAEITKRYIFLLFRNRSMAV